MGCEDCAPCALCPHPRKWHGPPQLPGCAGSIPRYIASVSGPGAQLNTPCTCTGYVYQEATVTTPNNPVAAAAAPADVAGQVAADVDQLATAARDLFATVNEAHRVYQATLVAAHQAYAAVYDRLHHAAPAAPASDGNGGAQ